MANLARPAFGQNSGSACATVYRRTPLTALIFTLAESELQIRITSSVAINGQNFLDGDYACLSSDENDHHVLTRCGGWMLRSTIRGGPPVAKCRRLVIASAFSRNCRRQPENKAALSNRRRNWRRTRRHDYGDTGTGRSRFTPAIRQAQSGQTCPALNCASIPEDAVESELFGHAPEGKKGFFEQANGGSVLLDEIGEMSPRMQTKLLRFLNDGTFRRVGEDHEVHVDVRVICATQKNLVELVQKRHVP